MNIDLRRRSANMKMLAITVTAGAMVANLYKSPQWATMLVIAATAVCYYLGTEWEDY